jgi:hypothetical protein
MLSINYLQRHNLYPNKQKKMKIKNSIKYIFAILVFILPIYIYLTPPSDTDGGPMLAYNFLFFYPILFVSTLISLFLIGKSLSNFKHKKIENLFILFSTIPTILLLLLILINFNYPKTNQLRNFK